MGREDEGVLEDVPHAQGKVHPPGIREPPGDVGPDELQDPVDPYAGLVVPAPGGGRPVLPRLGHRAVEDELDVVLVQERNAEDLEDIKIVLIRLGRNRRAATKGRSRSRGHSL